MYRCLKNNSSELHKRIRGSRGSFGSQGILQPWSNCGSTASPSGDGHRHGSNAQLQVTPEEDDKFVADHITDDANYIKVIGSPGLPLLSNDALITAVEKAHRHNKLAVAHTLAAEAAKRTIAASVDGLAHVWIDRPDSEVVATIAASSSFVTPYLVFHSSITDNTGMSFAADSRVASKLSSE